MTEIAYSEYSIYIPAEENEIPVLVIENPIDFRNLIMDLLAQQAGAAGKLTVTKDARILHLGREGDLIFNPFDFSAKEKQLVSRLQADAKKNAFAEHHYMATQQIFSQLLSYFDQLSSDYPFGIETDIGVDMGYLLKAVDFRYDSSGETLLERIVQYLAAAKGLLNPGVFIFINLKNCLTDEELQQLYTEAAYRKYALFLIESSDRPTLPEEKKVILDRNRCVIQLFNADIL